MTSSESLTRSRDPQPPPSPLVRYPVVPMQRRPSAEAVKNVLARDVRRLLPPTLAAAAAHAASLSGWSALAATPLKNYNQVCTARRSRRFTNGLGVESVDPWHRPSGGRAHINRSLSTLSPPPHADKKATPPRGHRRFDTRTFLMDSLGGNPRTTMVATVSPSVETEAHTRSTLRYAGKMQEGGVSSPFLPAARSALHYNKMAGNRLLRRGAPA